MTKLVEEDATHLVEEDNIQHPAPNFDRERPTVITSDTARQGPLGKPVLWVLVGALVLVGVGWMVVHALA